MNDNSSYELGRVFGTAFITLGIVIVIYTFGMSISGIVSKYNVKKEVAEARQSYTVIETACQVYNDMDSLYAEGNIDEMYNVYYANIGEINMTGYRKYFFLDCLHNYYETVNSYEKYTDDTYTKTSSRLASFLYDAFSMVDVVNDEAYKSLNGSDREYIDVRIAEVKGYIYAETGLEGEELTELVNGFKYQGKYHVEYSKVLEYAKERWGE